MWFLCILYIYIYIYIYIYVCVCVCDPGPQNQSEVSIFQNWNVYIIWKLNKTQGVKTFEQNEDVYIFPVLPKYHIFFI